MKLISNFKHVYFATQPPSGKHPNYCLSFAADIPYYLSYFGKCGNEFLRKQKQIVLLFLGKTNFDVHHIYSQNKQHTASNQHACTFMQCIHTSSYCW